MKKAIHFLLILFPIMVIGQTQTENYIKSVTYKVPTQTAISAPSITQAAQSITYFDGLGRPIQQISSQQSNSGKDIVTPIEYDAFGRQTKEYLPYKAESTNMTFDPEGISKVLSYYGSPNPAVNGNPNLEATTNPYSQKELEASPLNRVLKQAAPGNDWILGSGHEIKLDYQTNIADEVKLFVANANWDATAGLYTTSFSNNGHYTANELYKNVTYDENTVAPLFETNGATVEFKNKEGQVVLKRTYGTVGTGTVNEKHDTYYVYDIYGNLTYVIPPKAIDLIGATTTTQADLTSTAVVASGSSLQLTATNSIRLLDGFHAQAGSTFSAVIVNGNQSVLDNLCYQYKYDYRNRLVEKKLPGKQWEFIVYDKLDRVVATGPALSPFTDITSQGWTVTKYDAFNRPIITAWQPATVTSAGRKTLQESLNGSNTLSETKSASDVTINGVTFRYSNVAWPMSDYHLLTVNYFDDYNYPNATAVPSTVETQAVYYNNTVIPKGLVTGSWVRVLESSTSYRNELSYSLYDAKARPIRTYSHNFLGGYTYTDSKLDFSGKIEYSVTKHKRLSSDVELITKDIFTYSDQDRLLTQTHQINNGTIEVIADNTYDELGQLISKKIGGNTQKIDYAYNIRGWLKEINKVDALQQTADPKDLFAFEINYNNPNAGISGVNALYNGNIAETHWATNSDAGIVRSYGYRYDNLNRLKDAVFKNEATVTNTYNEMLTYDKNGNIVSLKRNGVNGVIDDLVYNYANSNTANVLMKVIDNVPSTEGFRDSPTNAVDDYAYDANGNMIKDNNKNVIEIKYKHLNLPTKITFNNGENIIYLYTATGQKVQKIVNRASILPENTDYLGGYQYFKNDLKFFPTAEGYVEPLGSSYKYVYQYKDHLGNIRLSYDKNLVIQEENNYYPFGLKQEGYNIVKNGVENKYKYNGKELQDELGLNTYDYGFRHYMPDIGRMGNIDMLAELAYDMTPNRYCFNNPMRFIDPSGLWETTAGGYSTNKAEDIKRFMSYLGFENNALNNSPTFSQQSTFIEGEMSAGGQGKLSDGSTLADEFSVTTYKQQGGGIKGYADEKTFGDFWHGVQKNLTPNGLDTRTIGQNLLGLTYPGGNNPKTYSGVDDFSYVPSSLAEYPAIGHDRRYANIGTAGAGGLFTDTRAVGADWRFVGQELSILTLPVDLKTKVQAGVLGVGLGLFSTGKTIIQLSSPYNGGIGTVLLWDSVANKGVNNKPSSK